ncbi:hypothetical protein [Acetobacter oeni]|uniref:hypothetical protein n=1 Tax=Acetobacter oeni TaxID=304077 RepID=UPI0015686F49|nr:hypothetical protein [Acetobacter oeni]MBB3881963.1 hypothetical protein [Acetobacter oeni]NHO17717.1 hypothetical protein [Acetobacter oeni]
MVTILVPENEPAVTGRMKTSGCVCGGTQGNGDGASGLRHRLSRTLMSDASVIP